MERAERPKPANDGPIRSNASGSVVVDRMRVKNRRKFYLDENPSYFTRPELELAEPLLYDRCVRIFRSPAEREADGRSKGFSGSLEADLYRSEARLAALTGSSSYNTQDQVHEAGYWHVSYVRGDDGQIVPEDHNDLPQNKEEGMQRWQEEMTLRFLTGNDADFPYEEVDNNAALDVIKDMDAEDKYFDDEAPQWADNSNHAGGETGIQDF